MIRIFCSVGFGLIGLLVSPQATMNIYQTNGSILQITLASIDSVTFPVTPPPPVMVIHQSSGSELSLVLSDIDSITYSLGGVDGTPQVVTLSPSSITAISVQTGGYVSAQGGSPVIARGVCWGTAPSPTTSDNTTNDGNGLGSYTSAINGLSPSTTYYARAFAINSIGTAYGNQIQFTTNAGGGSWLNPDLTYGSVADVDGNTYPTIVVGTQEWLAENLRTTHYANGDPIPNVIEELGWPLLIAGAWSYYGNDPQYNIPYGKLYNWYAVADGRNVCMSGWHVPSEAEWTVLTNFLGGVPVAGGKVKSIGTIEAGTGLWYAPNIGATNESGFSGVPAGRRQLDGVTYTLGNDSHWWSSTIDTGTAGDASFEFSVYEDIEGLYPFGIYQPIGNSVRCIRD